MIAVSNPEALPSNRFMYNEIQYILAGVQMNTWRGGIHKHPNGYYAYVPKKTGGAGYKGFRKTLNEASAWQDRKGREEWGDAWSVIKETGGYEYRLLGRNRQAKTGTKVAPGVTIVRRERTLKGKPTGTYESLVRVTYMELSNDGSKRQRIRTFSFGTPKSKYTMEEAIEKGVALRKRVEQNYGSTV